MATTIVACAFVALVMLSIFLLIHVAHLRRFLVLSNEKLHLLHMKQRRTGKEMEHLQDKIRELKNRILEIYREREKEA